MRKLFASLTLLAWATSAPAQNVRDVQLAPGQSSLWGAALNASGNNDVSLYNTANPGSAPAGFRFYQGIYSGSQSLLADLNPQGAIFGPTTGGYKGPGTINASGIFINGIAAGGITQLTGDVTAGPGSGSQVATLATVNSNTGTWGSATLCAAFTTNAKGLITAAAQSACTPALANITGMGTGVASALAIAIGSAGSVVTNGGALGTPSSGVATNLTNIPTANLTGAGAGCVAWLVTPASANLRSCVSDETGTGLLYFQNGHLGTPASATLTNATGLVPSAGLSATGTPSSSTFLRGDNTWQTVTGTGTVTSATIAPGNGISATGTCTITTTGTCTVAFAPPKFSASLSANQSPLTNGTFTKVQFNTKLVDTNTWYDATTNFRFTPQIAGFFQVATSVQGTGSTSITEVDCDIYKNGATYARNLGLASGVANSTAVNKMIQFNGTTDYVEVFCSVSGTGTLSFLGGTGPIRSWFEATYVGP